VNCVGVMGKGVAEQFKLRFPAMFEDYKRRTDRKAVQLGEPYLYRDHAAKWGITGIALPPLGCGNGGLEWSEVGPLAAK
jgi:hypothetical protein